MDQNTTEIPQGEMRWVLTRYLGSRQTSKKGKLLGMSESLGQVIHIAEVIAEMNTRNCFDFEYVPQEKDVFHIDNGLKGAHYQYFSLIFKLGKWEKGRNPAFGRSITERIARGKVKNENHKSQQ